MTLRSSYSTGLITYQLLEADSLKDAEKLSSLERGLYIERELYYSPKFT